jgi:hypothetical protein
MKLWDILAIGSTIVLRPRLDLLAPVAVPAQIILINTVAHSVVADGEAILNVLIHHIVMNALEQFLGRLAVTRAVPLPALSKVLISM